MANAHGSLNATLGAGGGRAKALVDRDFFAPILSLSLPTLKVEKKFKSLKVLKLNHRKSQYRWTQSHVSNLVPIEKFFSTLATSIIVFTLSRE